MAAWRRGSFRSGTDYFWLAIFSAGNSVGQQEKSLIKMPFFGRKPPRYIGQRKNTATDSCGVWKCFWAQNDWGDALGHGRQNIYAHESASRIECGIEKH